MVDFLGSVIAFIILAGIATLFFPPLIIIWIGLPFVVGGVISSIIHMFDPPYVSSPEPVEHKLYPGDKNYEEWLMIKSIKSEDEIRALEMLSTKGSPFLPEVQSVAAQALRRANNSENE